MAAVKRTVPQRDEHLDRAYQNEKLAEQFARASSPVCIDWSITFLFYSALHFVDAFLAGKNLHPLIHFERNEEVENNGSLSEIHRHYSTLQKMSESARYQIANYAQRDYDRALEHFNQIKQHVLRKMRK